MNQLFAVFLLTIAFTTPALAQQENPMVQEFMNAATKGDASKIREMLRSSPILIKSKDEKGVSVILKATYYGKKDVVVALLESNPELDIFEASATGQSKRVAELLTYDKSLANAFAVDGFMPLGLAVFFGHSETVDLLLKAGANVNAPTREVMKVTPLASAAAAQQIGIARKLIANGANVNAKAHNDLTPLHEAAASGNLEFTKLLLESGADINARTTDGKTPLDLAVERKQTEMIEFLKFRGAIE
jgi:ankyrin repeat protein